MINMERMNDISMEMSKYFYNTYKGNDWSVTDSYTENKIVLSKNKEIQCTFYSNGITEISEKNSLTKEQLSDVYRFHRIINEINNPELSDQYKSGLIGGSESDNKPSYYKDANGKDLFYHLENGLMSDEMNKGFYTGNIFKYIFRHGKKDPKAEVEDLKKARDYLNELIKVTEEKVAKR